MIIKDPNEDGMNAYNIYFEGIDPLMSQDYNRFINDFQFKQLVIDVYNFVLEIYNSFSGYKYRQYKSLIDELTLATDLGMSIMDNKQKYLTFIPSEYENPTAMLEKILMSDVAFSLALSALYSRLTEERSVPNIPEYKAIGKFEEALSPNNFLESLIHAMSYFQDDYLETKVILLKIQFDHFPRIT